jgi:hypothetical protein
VHPLDPWDLTRVMREGRKALWNRVPAMCERGAWLAATAARPGVRSSRRVRGLATATAEDAWQLRKHADGIARASWEIDIHPPDRAEGKAIAYDDPAYLPRVRRTQAGDWFDIRYGCLVAAGVDNLLMAGRCLSAEHEAQASLRIQQTCMSTGQAAGTAAALSLKAETPPRALDPMRVVHQLDEDRAATKPAWPE